MIARPRVMGIAAAILVLCTPNGVAQSAATDRAAASMRSRVVYDEAGDLQPPWKISKVCRDAKDPSTCMAALLNPETHELAKVGEKWSTAFAATGKGKEVRRVGSK